MRLIIEAHLVDHEGSTELFVPSSNMPKNLTHYEVARTIVVMMRLVCDP